MLTIGGFSRRGGISTRMLRHYDQLGLLRPARVGQNGYRYYSDEQLPVLRKIEALKGYGFALGEIAPLLALPEDELARRIHARRLAAYAQLAQLRRRLQEMEEAIQNMEVNTMDDRYQVTVQEAPPLRVFALRKTINISQTHQLFEELYEQVEKRGLVPAGPAQQAFMGEEFDYDNLDLEAQVPVAADADGDGVKTLPGGLVAITAHTGPYEEVRYAYEAVGGWLKAHPEYEVLGPGTERYLKNEDEVDSPEELVTEVLFPVKKKDD